MENMRFILDLKDHPALSAGFVAHEKQMKNFDERKEFISRQMKNFVKEMEDAQENHWALVVQYAKEHELVPKDFDLEKQCLHFNEKHRQIFSHDKSEHEGGLGALLGILGMKGPFGDGK